MKRNIAFLFCFVFLAFGFFYLYQIWFLKNKNNPVVKKELPVSTSIAKEYSVGGKVLSVEGNKITVNVGRVFSGPNGNYVEYEKKTVSFADNTGVYFVKVENNKFVETKTSTSSIKIGDQVSVYSMENITLLSSFVAPKIYIQSPSIIKK